MDLEFRWKCQAISMRGTLKTTKRMEKVKYYLKMVISTKDNLWIIYTKVMEFTLLKIKIDMRVNGSKEADREKESY